MSKQQIPLKKVKFIDTLTDPQHPRPMVRAALKTQATITSSKFVQNVVNHSNQKYAQVIAILTALPQAIEDYVAAGHSCQIENFCTVKPVINVRAVNTPDDCKADTIKNVKVRIIPIGQTADLVKKWGFKMTDTVTNGTASDDGENGGQQTGGNGGTNTGNQNQGGNQQTVEDVTYTFKYHDGTEDTRTGQPGEAVNAPAADEGYHWPSYLPTVFGSVNQTFTEIEDSAQLSASEGVTVKWTWHTDNKVNGSALAKEMIVPVGSTIDESEWPEAHEGYHWNSTPEDLNLNVPYKRAGEWYYIREQKDE